MHHNTSISRFVLIELPIDERVAPLGGGGGLRLFTLHTISRSCTYATQSY